MLLGEPQRTRYDLNFVLLGIPVRVHPFFWLIGLLLGINLGGPPEVLIWLTAFFLGVLCHELGHAVVMRSQGCFAWITLYGLGGMASYDRMRRLSTARAEALQQIFISAAGPLAGFLLAVVTIIFIQVFGHKVEYLFGGPFGLTVRPVDLIWNQHLTGFVYDLLFVTIAYGILNLLPIYPLDGGQIVRELFVLLFGADGVRQSLILSMVIAGILAVMGAVQWHSLFFALLFGYFAYASYATLQGLGGRGPW